MADCIRLFSLDADHIVPVDTHVFQIAKKMSIIKAAGASSLNDAMYLKINEAFVDFYGPKTGWAHQIVFAGELK